MIPCPFGYLRGLLYPSHKVPHGPEPAQIGQSFFKTIEVVNRGIPHPPELHRERIARHHFRRYPDAQPPLYAAINSTQCVVHVSDRPGD